MLNKQPAIKVFIMKTFNYLAAVLFGFLLSFNALSQNDFIINKQTLNDNLSIKTIQHQNDKYAEFIKEENEGFFDISIKELRVLNIIEANLQNYAFKKIPTFFQKTANQL